MKGLLKQIRRPPKALIAIYAVTFTLMIAGFIALYVTVGKNLSALLEDPDLFKAWLDGYKGFGAVIFVAIRAFQTVIKVIPAEPLEIASGYVFGNWGGLLYCSLGSFLGTLIILLLTRWFGKRFVSTFIDVDQLAELPILEDNRKRRTFLIIFYLIPGTPKDMMTYAAGLSKMNLWEFMILTTICRIPSIITSTWCGSALGEKQYTLAIIIFVATAVGTLLCTLLYKHLSGKGKKQFVPTERETHS